MSIIGIIIWAFVGYSSARLVKTGYSKLSRRAKLDIACHIFIPLTLLAFMISGIAMVVAVLNLFLTNWIPMLVALGTGAVSGAACVGLGMVASHFDDKLRLVDGRGPFKEPVYAKDRPSIRQPLEIAKPDPLYATWDEIIGFHTVEKVVADLPDSIRGDFTPPSPLRGSIDRHVYTGGGLLTAEIHQFGQEKPVRIYSHAELDRRL